MPDLDTHRTQGRPATRGPTTPAFVPAFLSSRTLALRRMRRQASRWSVGRGVLANGGISAQASAEPVAAGQDHDRDRD